MINFYYTEISPFSRKCRILARELGIINSINEVLITSMRDPNSLIMTINPTGKVPALTTSDKNLICESFAICNYFEEVAGFKIGSMDKKENWELNGLETLASQVLESIVYRVIEKKIKPKEFIHKETILYEKLKVNKALDYLEKKSGIFKNKINRVQITLGIAFLVMYRAFPEENWQKGRDNLNEIVEKIKLRPSFIQT